MVTKLQRRRSPEAPATLEDAINGALEAKGDRVPDAPPLPRRKTTAKKRPGRPTPAEIVAMSHDRKMALLMKGLSNYNDLADYTAWVEQFESAWLAGDPNVPYPGDPLSEDQKLPALRAAKLAKAEAAAKAAAKIERPTPAQVAAMSASEQDALIYGDQGLARYPDPDHAKAWLAAHEAAWRRGEPTAVFPGDAGAAPPTVSFDTNGNVVVADALGRRLDVHSERFAFLKDVQQYAQTSSGIQTFIGLANGACTVGSIALASPFMGASIVNGAGAMVIMTIGEFAGRHISAGLGFLVALGIKSFGAVVAFCKYLWSCGCAFARYLGDLLFGWWKAPGDAGKQKQLEAALAAA